MRNRFLELATKIERPGIQGVLQFLDASDFYSAPCSARHHLNVPGGLVTHSLNVFDLVYLKSKAYNLGHLSEETMLISALFHDVCKVGVYAIDNEPATAPQAKYLTSLLKQTGTTLQGNENLAVMTKGYAGTLITWLKEGKNGDQPQNVPTYKVQDNFPVGHGEKSVIILQKYMQLTEEEILSIRWHMGPFTEGFSQYMGAYNDACKKSPLVPLLFTSDMEATHIFEKK